MSDLYHLQHHPRKSTQPNHSVSRPKGFATRSRLFYLDFSLRLTRFNRRENCLLAFIAFLYFQFNSFEFFVWLICLFCFFFSRKTRNKDPLEKQKVKVVRAPRTYQASPSKVTPTCRQALAERCFEVLQPHVANARPIIAKLLVHGKLEELIEAQDPVSALLNDPIVSGLDHGQVGARCELPAACERTDVSLKRWVSRSGVFGIEKKVEDMREALRSFFTDIDADFRAYGSAMNGFSLKGSDVDFSMIVDQAYLRSDSLCGDFLEQHVVPILIGRGYHLQNTAYRAKIPIITMIEPTYGERIDISVNNVMPLINTALLKAYCRLDSRVYDLVAVVKGWAKSRGISDSKNGHLSSYSWTLLVIFYLQAGTPTPFLPSLQELAKKDKPEAITPWAADVPYPNLALDAANHRSHLCFSTEWTIPQESGDWHLSSLFHGFVDFYLDVFDWDREVVSVRLGRRVLKTDKELLMAAPKAAALSIEDPLELHRNLNCVMSCQGVSHLHSELHRVRGRVADIFQAPHKLQENSNGNTCQKRCAVPKHMSYKQKIVNSRKNLLEELQHTRSKQCVGEILNQLLAPHLPNATDFVGHLIDHVPVAAIQECKNVQQIMQLHRQHPRGQKPVSDKIKLKQKRYEVHHQRLDAQAF